ncbi:MAG: hypothetical protein RLZ10_2013 [Bacteroidota bacterium]|jgi:hypothetical protein
MVNKVFIYCLKDPSTYEVRYVGKTKYSLEKRLTQHISRAKSILENKTKIKNNKRYSWIISLINLRTKPIIELIEEVDETIWSDREKFWITQYPNLTNMTIGGDGGDTNSGRTFRKKTDEEKKIISERTKINMNRPDIKEKVRKGAYMTMSKILDENRKLRHDIVEKIRESSKKKVNIFNKGVFVEKLNSIFDFISKYKTSYCTFNRKPKKFINKEYFIDLQDFNLKEF